MPFISQTKGKTLHLLKENSKPVPQQRKRMKRDVYGTPAAFNLLMAQNAHVASQ